MSRVLDPDSVDQLATAVRQAATAQHPALPDDGAEAVIRQEALDVIPSPPPPEPAARAEPDLVIVARPLHIIGVIRESCSIETPGVVHALRPYRPYKRLPRFPRQGSLERERFPARGIRFSTSISQFVLPNRPSPISFRATRFGVAPLSSAQQPRPQRRLSGGEFLRELEK